MVSKERKREEAQEKSPKKTEANPYEKSKEQRIQENKEKMQQLGLPALALKLQSNKKSSLSNKINKPKNKKSPFPAADDQPTRTSSRLKEMPRVSYHEERIAKEKEKGPKNVQIHIKDGDKPEIYTEEHLKLLGDCKTQWNGDDDNRNRTHDQEKGKSCHQCRQKTLGLRIQCSKCKSGQFCGDCLYTRYGENLIEAKEEEANWICPICRDICNCSNCRVKKGWKPTKNIYKQVAYLGYKSVAHYLIQTRQQNSVGSSGETENVGSAKSSSSFEESQPPPHNESLELEEGSER